MRRIVLTTFGPPEVLTIEEVPSQPPGPGMVAIAVAFAGVTFVETQVRAGRPPWDAPLPATPYYPGNGVEGVVEAVGAGVDPELIGTRVVSATGGSGGYADRALVSHLGLIRVPDGLAAGHGVALLADGRTAMSAVRASALRKGEVALITAAAGGVGGLLVQLARSEGARKIIALAGGPDKCAEARTLGADVVLDYREPGWIDELSVVVESNGLDVVFDGVGGQAGRNVFDMMPPRSRLCAFGMSSGSYTDATVRDVVLRGVTVVGGVQVHSPTDSVRLSGEALDAAVAGRLRARIGAVFPLERAAEAHRAVESRALIGKALLAC